MSIAPTDKTVDLRIPGYDRAACITGAIDDQSVVGAIEYNRGLYEHRLMERVRQRLEPDSISLDIGANIGVISIAMAWASPHGQVYAFEASRSNYHHLCLNVGENTLGNVAPLHLALYDERTQLEVCYVPDVAGCSFLSPAGVREGVAESVEAVPLDEWVAERAIPDDPPIRLIKMDIEGAEYRALTGGRRTLERHRPDLLIEFNPSPIERFFDEDPRDLAELLLEIFPYVEALDPEGGPSFPIDSFEYLMEMVLRGPGWLDLHCRF